MVLLPGNISNTIFNYRVKLVENKRQMVGLFISYSVGRGMVSEYAIVR
jgi:hypothetical protein